MSYLPGAYDDAPVIVLDDEDRIACDVCCIGCGRNLRGTEQSGRCPQCRTPVSRSGRGDSLGVAHPAWVSRLAEGPSYIVASLILRMVLCIGSSPWGTLVVNLIAGTFCVVGFWFVTAPEPVHLHREPRLSLRRTARWGFILAHVVSLIGCVVAFANTRSAEWVRLFAFAIDTAAMVCVGLWAAHLARRLPDRILERMTRIFAWGLIATAPAMAVCSAIRYTVDDPSRLDLTSTGMQISMVATIGVIICYILSILLVFEYRKRLRGASYDAYRSWIAA